MLLFQTERNNFCSLFLVLCLYKGLCAVHLRRDHLGRHQAVSAVTSSRVLSYCSHTAPCRHTCAITSLQVSGVVRSAGVWS